MLELGKKLECKVPAMTDYDSRLAKSSQENQDATEVNCSWKTHSFMVSSTFKITIKTQTTLNSIPLDQPFLIFNLFTTSVLLALLHCA